MKKFVLMLMMAAMVVLMTGCMQADYHLTINKDLSGQLAYKIGMSSDIMDLTKKSGQDPLQQIRDEYEKAGYKVKSFKDSEYEGVVIIKKFKDVRKADISLQTDRTKNVEADTKLEFHQSKGFFTTKSIVDIEVNMTAKKLANQLSQMSGEDANALQGAGEDELKAAFAMMGESVKMSFTLTLPGKVSKHGDLKLSDGGKTVQWKLKFGEVNKLHVEASDLNTTNLAIVIGGAVVLLGGAVIFFRRRKSSTFVYETVEAQAVSEVPAADAESKQD
jgi:LPXTG-motif cell wall-anchored protein